MLLLARLLIVPLFFVSGYKKFSAVGPTAVRIAEKFVVGFGLTAAWADAPVWRALAILAGCAEWAGALLVLLGWRFGLGVGILIVYLIPVTLTFHFLPWWRATDPTTASVEAIALLKNLAIMAGLLAMASAGPGRLALAKKR